MPSDRLTLLYNDRAEINLEGRDLSHTSRSTVFITGASSGIGKATALLMAEQGYVVFGTSRFEDRLADLQREATERGVDVKGVVLDINDERAVDSAMPRLLEEAGGAFDVLVNNAGYGLWGPIQSLAMDELRTQFETNFFAAFRLTNAVLPAMIERRRGTIINVSSVLGRIATPFNGAYAASKFALEGMSEALRVELRPFGVKVALVEPGLFETGFIDNMTRSRASERTDLPYQPYMDRYRNKHRRFELRAADPIEVAKVILKIARSRNPSLRHPVGLDARSGLLGARLLPQRLFEAMLARATLD